jgi:hypothetical protein
MKVLFVGPTLWRDVVAGRLAVAPDIVCRGPAGQGDLAAAALEGASAMGLIDGRYEDVAAPWHKEILFALSEGVAVFGGASLGALRAAECAHFGMIGVGAIYQRYANGELVDDSAVAQLHGPAELGHMPVTEALVNVEATIASLLRQRLIDPALAGALDAGARALFFKRLTYPALIASVGAPAALLDFIEEHRVDAKRDDALALAARLATAEDARQAKPSWALSRPTMWRRQLLRLIEARRARVS